MNVGGYSITLLPSGGVISSTSTQLLKGLGVINQAGKIVCISESVKTFSKEQRLK